MAWGSKLSNVETGGKLSMGYLHRGLERIKLVWRPELRYARNTAPNFGELLADTMRFCDGQVVDAYWKKSRHRIKSYKTA